jgi:hypothetical protein
VYEYANKGWQLSFKRMLGPEELTNGLSYKMCWGVVLRPKGRTKLCGVCHRLNASQLAHFTDS